MEGLPNSKYFTCEWVPFHLHAMHRIHHPLSAHTCTFPAPPCYRTGPTTGWRYQSCNFRCNVWICKLIFSELVFSPLPWLLLQLVLFHSFISLSNPLLMTHGKAFQGFMQEEIQSEWPRSHVGKGERGGPGVLQRAQQGVATIQKKN